MSKGFTMIELVLTIIVLGILSAFTFSVIWQYSNLYATTKGGYIYAEAAAVMERMTRELRDAQAVDTSGTCFTSGSCINLQIAHGTPAMGWVDGIAPGCPNSCAAAPWVQYCACSGSGRTSLYRISNTSQGAGNQCANGCPPPGNTKPMSGNLTNSGFQVTCYPGNGTCGSPGPISDAYMLKLKLTSDSANSQSVTLVSRVTPRNYVPGIGSERDFSGAYYDENK
jgi:prepilin-type N-terminal cleavage/methylation domain-containing protein